MPYGLDIGGTKIELAIFDDKFRIVNSWRVDTPRQGYSYFLNIIEDMVFRADQQTGGKDSVGIGLPGFIGADGRVIAANIPCLKGKDLLNDLPFRLERPTGFENDVKAFVLSEVTGGAANGFRHALGVVLGTGVAGGLCMDGKLYHGRQNIACEFGHIPLPAMLQQRYQLPLRQCGCGSIGCVECYLSGPGLQWLCSHFSTDYTDVKHLVKGLEQNDPDARKVFDAYIDCLGNYFAQLILMFDPDIIVLGGGLSNISQIYDELPPVISNYLFENVTPPPVIAPLFGDSSGVRGAAMLGRQVMLAARECDD